MEQWYCEVLEILNDVVESLGEFALPDPFHEGIPLNSVASNEVRGERLKLPIWYRRLPIPKSGFDCPEKNGHIEVEISRTDPDVVDFEWLRSLASTEATMFFVSFPLIRSPAGTVTSTFLRAAVARSAAVRGFARAFVVAPGAGLRVLHPARFYS